MEENVVYSNDFSVIKKVEVYFLILAKNEISKMKTAIFIYIL